MKNFLIGIGLHLGTSAVAIIVAALLLRDFRLHFLGFLMAVVVFTVAQALLSGLVTKLAQNHAPSIAGAASLISTFLALVIANLFRGVEIHRFTTWIFATLIVWVVTAAGALLRPKIMGKVEAK
ncbi:hypothetical protein AL755_22050 [Arthrobacter sp. ERGS1:01]|uniref:phage holin family protein n=1 Tax=Arthrobacter sp. ERGS1:01 TaxID=1704044 RepID=UPI0006B60222|nr:phage holin family protein [Arthrobacter sp. ERGS1:01]ALE07540.1 hypothetical protein AL755_22050 [Arthrobacter sp. ERGS1:01]